VAAVTDVNLTRLWYIFPPDDQDLRTAEFSSKVKSYVAALSDSDRVAVLDFLIVQYAAFERQLEIMRTGCALSPAEHRQRAEKLAQHQQALMHLRSQAAQTCGRARLQ
jgi:hypothetical protein